MENYKKNVGKINQKYLCIGCGACSVVCPVGVIEIKSRNGELNPCVKEEGCINCGKCIKVCPGISVSIEETSRNLFLGNDFDSDLGRFKATYTGFSNDEKVRFGSASGGVATALVIYMLEKGIVQGAILTKVDKENPLETRAFIARTANEVISAQSSKYLPSSSLVGLKEIKNLKTEDKFVFVGLPCQIHGLRKLEEEDPQISEKIAMSIGIFCGHGVNSLGISSLLNRFASGDKNICSVKYRGRGWPGSIEVEYRDGSQYDIKHNKYWPLLFSQYFFTPLRCLSCSDLTSELADISLGDAWLSEIQAKDSQGTSVVITRSDFAEQVLAQARKDNFLSLEKINFEKVIESQKGILKRKKLNIGSRIKILKSFLLPVPQLDQEFKYNFVGLAGGLLIFINALFSKSRLVQEFLERCSEDSLKIYSYLIFKLTGK